MTSADSNKSEDLERSKEQSESSKPEDLDPSRVPHLGSRRDDRRQTASPSNKLTPRHISSHLISNLESTTDSHEQQKRTPQLRSRGGTLDMEAQALRLERVVLKKTLRGGGGITRCFG